MKTYTWVIGIDDFTSKINEGWEFAGAYVADGYSYLIVKDDDLSKDSASDTTPNDSATSEVARLKCELEARIDLYDKLRMKFDAMEAQRNDWRARAGDLEQERDNLQAELDETQDDLAEVRRNLDASREAEQEMRDAVDEARTLLGSYGS